MNRLRPTAPDSRTVGGRAQAVATLNQGGRRIRVGYPMQSVWPSSATVHVGRAGDAPATAVVAFDPRAGRLTALKRGVARLKVLVNGTSASHTLSLG